LLALGLCISHKHGTIACADENHRNQRGNESLFELEHYKMQILHHVLK